MYHCGSKASKLAMLSSKTSTLIHELYQCVPVTMTTDIVNKSVSQPALHTKLFFNPHCSKMALESARR